MAPEEDIGRAVIGAAIKGPHDRRTWLAREVAVPSRYEEIVVEQGYRLDLLVENIVVDELRRHRQSCQFIAPSC